MKLRYSAVHLDRALNISACSAGIGQLTRGRAHTALAHPGCSIIFRYTQ